MHMLHNWCHLWSRNWLPFLWNTNICIYLNSISVTHLLYVTHSTTDFLRRHYTTKLKTERHVTKLDWSKADAGGIPCCQTCCGRIMFTPHVALLSSMFIFLYVTVVHMLHNWCHLWSRNWLPFLWNMNICIYLNCISVTHLLYVTHSSTSPFTN
jgi:ABC-type enterochelin transport system permease subunit